jgi:hypothetical protein
MTTILRPRYLPIEMREIMLYQSSCKIITRPSWLTRFFLNVAKSSDFITSIGFLLFNRTRWSSFSRQINSLSLLSENQFCLIFDLLRKSVIWTCGMSFCWILLNIICDKWKFQSFNQLTCLGYITCCSNSICWHQAPSSILWEQTFKEERFLFKFSTYKVPKTK